MDSFAGYENIAELIKKDLLLDKIAQSSPLAYYVVDNRSDKILYFNKKFCEIWNIESLQEKMLHGQLKNKDVALSCLSLVVDKQSFIESCKLLQSENNTQTVEDEIEFCNGKTIRRFTCQVRDNNENYIGRLYIFEDITEMKKNELHWKMYQEKLEKLIQDRTANLEKAVRKLKYIAKYDFLTKIPNRYYFEEVLDKLSEEAESKDNTLLLVDIDNFKTINDSFGRIEGDKVLIEIVNCIKENLRSSDFLARLEGDQFVVLLSNTNIKNAEVIANRLIKGINEKPFYIGRTSVLVNITASIGLIEIEQVVDKKQIFHYADAALYEAKEKGKNRAVALKNDSDKNKILQNNFILNLIYDAFKENRFFLHFQPIYRMGSLLMHYEVLVRMFDENNNIVPPGTFIPVAERYGLMHEIDQWVIENTLKILNEKKDLNVFINLSGVSLGNDKFLQWVENTISKCGISPNRIGFEITETTAIKDLEKTKRWVCRLKALGCNFALDDFGVGFSSFSYLHILPVDYLKIDGSFIRNLDSDPTKLALVKAMNAVAHTLGKKTIAEFVETETIWIILQELGVDCGQGYFLGKPVPIEYC